MLHMLRKKRVHGRRVTAWLLVLCMMVSMCPQVTLAENAAGSFAGNTVETTVTPDLNESDKTAGGGNGKEQNAASSDEDVEYAEDMTLGDTDINEASPSDATPSNALRTEAAKKFADGVKSLDADKLMALAQAYVDVAKELAAYTNQEPELIEEAKRAELQKKFEEADTAFWAVYDTVNGQTETSLLKQYEALSEEEKESVAEEYQILDQLIQKVDALLAVMYGANTLAAVKYPVVVGGKQVDDSNKDDVLGNGTVAFTPASGTDPATLTLTNATIKGGTGFVINDGMDRLTTGYGGIVATGSLKIEVIGKNTVSGIKTGIVKTATYNTYFNSGICVLNYDSAGNLEIVGEEGSVLNVTGGDNSGSTVSSSSVTSDGIYSAGIALDKGDLTISNVTVKARAGNGKANNTIGAGICNLSGSITIDHANVTATSPDTEGKLYGLFCEGDGPSYLSILNGSDVTAIAGKTTANSYGIWVSKQYTTGGEISINGTGSILKATRGDGKSNGPIGRDPALAIDQIDDYKFMVGNDESGATEMAQPAKLSNVTTPYLGIISKTLPTPAPTFASGENTYKMPGKQSVIASFPVSNHEAGTTYTLYSAATGGSQVTDPSLNLAAGIVTFSLNYSAPPTADQDYWVSATKGGIESTSRTQISVKKAASDKCEVLAFRTNASDKEVAVGKINDTELTLALALKYEYKDMLSSLPVALKVSEGATVMDGNMSLKSETIDGEKYWTGTYDFNGDSSVSFQVFPEDGSTAKRYTATAKIPSYTVDYELDLTKVTKQDGPSTIKYGEPFSAAFSPKTGYSLAPDWVTVTRSGTTLSQGTDYSAVLNEAGDITVTVEDVQVNGTITIKVDAKGTASQLTGFTVANQVGNTVIDQTSRTVTVIMPIGTNLSAVSPTVTASPGATVSPASGAPTDFSNSETTPVTYKVTAEDGKTSQEYKVTVKIVKYSIDYTFTMILPDSARVFEIGMNQPLELTLHAETGYTLPAREDTENLEVMMGGTKLTSDQYTYQVAGDRTAATFAIASVTGDVSIKLNALHAEKKITGFTIANAFTTVMDEDNHTISVEMPHGTDLSRLTPTIKLSADTVINPASGIEQDFRTPQTYTVKAQNGDEQPYTVTVTIPTFTVAYPNANHVKKESGKESVELKEPFTATFTTDSGYILRTKVTCGDKTLEENTDYTWEYKAADGIYEITLIAESVTGNLKITTTAYNTKAELTDFHIPNEVHNVVSADGKMIEIEMPHGTDLKTLTPIFDVSEGAKVSKKSGVSQDFSESAVAPVLYRVTAEDGAAAVTYQVKVTVPSYPITYDMPNIKADPDRQKTAELNELLTLTLKTEDGYTVPPKDSANLVITMGGQVLTTSDYTYTQDTGDMGVRINIKVTGPINIKLTALRSGKDIKSFAIAGQYGDTKLDQNSKTINVEMPYETDLKTLKPIITLSDSATVSPAGDAEVDFTKPQTYTVTAENGKTQEYKVTVVIPEYTVDYQKSAHVSKEDGAESVSLKQQLVARFKADSGYILRTTVTRGNKTLAENTDYKWECDGKDPGSYTLTVFKDNVIGDLTITTTAFNTKAELTNFHITKEVNNTVSDDGKTIVIEMPYGTNLSQLTPAFTLSDKATSNPAPGTVQDFSGSADTPFTYTVTAEDGTTKETYNVKVTIPSFTITYENQNDNMDAASVKPAVAELMENPVITLKAKDGYSVPKAGDAENLIVKMNGKAIEAGTGYTYTMAQDRSSAALTVKDVSGDITVYVKALNQENKITFFATNRNTGTAADAVIDEAKGTIKLTLPHEFDVDMSAMPVRMLASEEAAVTVNGAPMEKQELTVDGVKAVYWVGAYDFTKDADGDPKTVVFTVVSADKDSTKEYTATAEIPFYTVTYTEASNIEKTAGEDTRQWLEPLTAVFKADENYEQQGIVVMVGKKTLAADTGYTYSYDAETRISTLTIPAEQVTDNITITPRAYHTMAVLSDFHIVDEVRNSVSDDGKTITVEMPEGTALDSLAPTFTQSTASNATPASGAAVDFSNSEQVPVTYTVAAEDGKTTQEYQVTVAIPVYAVESSLVHVNEESSTIPTEVKLHGTVSMNLVTEEGYTVPEVTDTENLKVTMMDGTDTKILTEGKDYTYKPSQNLSGAVIEIPMVTGVVKVEVKALSEAKAIADFTVANQVGDTRLSEDERTIEVDMPFGTDLSVLQPAVLATDSNAAVSPASGETTDFSHSKEAPVEYTVTAENGTTKVYEVTIIIPEYRVEYTLDHIMQDGLPESMALKQPLEAELKAESGYSVPEAVKIEVLPDTEAGTAVVLAAGTDYSYTPDISKDKAVIKFAKDLPVTGNIMITAAGESRMKRITGFTMENQVGDSVIDETAKTISAIVTYGTDLTSIEPVVKATDSNATVAPASGQSKDFTDSRKNPVIYTVTAEDRSTQDYKVTITYPTVTVTFDVRGGSEVLKQSLTAGEKAVKPAEPVKETNGTQYYAFDGWYQDAAFTKAYDFNEPVPEDITIYVKWKIGYKVLTEAENGTVATTERDDTRIFYPGETVTLKAVPNGGYQFGGWNLSLDAALLTEQNKAETTFIMPDKQVSFTARFYRKSSGGGGGGGGTSAGGSTSNITVGNTTTTTAENGETTSTTTVSGTNGSQATVEVKKDTAGNVISRDASVSLTQGQMNSNEGQLSLTYTADYDVVKKAAQTAGATSQSPLGVTIAVPAETLTAQLQNAQTNSASVNLTIPTALSSSADIRVNNIMLPKGSLEAAKAVGKDLTVSVKNEAGIELVAWSFNGAELKNSQTAVTDINLAVDLMPIPAISGERQELKHAVQSVSGEGLVITFRHSGQLPTTARIKIPSAVQRLDGISTGIQAEDEVRLYYYNPQTKRLELAGAQTYVTDTQNYVTILMNHCSDYVLVPVREGNQSGTQGQGSQTSSSSVVYTVQKGDNLWKIANRYGCSVSDLKAANPGINEMDLQVGQSVNVPAR